MADLNLAQTFITVYRTGNMTAAAKLLNLTQPAVTKQVAAFEAQTRRSLFVRRARGVTATPAAHALAEMLSMHLDAIDAAMAMQAISSGAIAGPLFIGGPTDFIGTAVLPALAAATAHGIQIRTQLGVPQELLNGLSGGTLDLVIATQRLPRRGVRFEALYTEEFVLVGAPRWADRLSSSAIAEHGARLFDGVPVLAYDETLPIVRRYWREVFKSKSPTTVAMLVPDLRSLAIAAGAGVGVTVLPRYLIASALQRRELVNLTPQTASPTNTLWLAQRVGPASPRLVFATESLRRAAVTW